MNDKSLVASFAAQQVKDGMLVGLGTGSTADCFIEALARRHLEEGLKVTTVASSPVSTLKAQELKLPLLVPDQIDRLDLYVDGADEVAPDLTLLKGRGQDLVREKLLAASSDQFWVLIDHSKRVDHIGERFPIPVEVHPWAWRMVRTLLERAGGKAEPRLGTAGVAITSAGGMVLDTVFDSSMDTSTLNGLLNSLPGILAHGIFHQLATSVLIGADGKVETLSPKHEPTYEEDRMMLLRTNQPAPDFTVPDQDGNPVNLADFRGEKNVVLYFYPKDDTPGCTIEANEFTQLAGEFAKHDTVVIGVSKDPCDTHRAFIAKYGLKIPLLADTDGALCERYGVWQEKEKAGVKKMGIVRSTFLIDKNGNLVYVEYGVNPEGHARAMLEKVSNLAG